MSQVPQTSSPVSTVSSGTRPSGEADALAGLARMSTTAGVGTADYVEVSTLAVVSLIVGCLSFLALFNVVLLAVPIIAIVGGSLAATRIRQSNGTQTGLPLALLAVLLGIGFAGYSFVNRVRAAAMNRSDEAAIASVISTLGEKIVAADFPGAYALFTDRFRGEVPLKEVTDVFTIWRQATLEGKTIKLQSVQKEALVEFVDNNDTGDRNATSVIGFKYPSEIQPPQQEIRLHKNTDRSWSIEALPSMFEKAKASRKG